jgi:putative lipoprotein
MVELPRFRVVRGTIELPEADLPDQAATLVIRLENVSRADAASTVVAEQRLNPVVLSGRSTLAFELEIPAGQIDERDRYSVSVHIDVSGSGELERGDLITKQSYPVLTGGHGEDVDIAVAAI